MREKNIIEILRDGGLVNVKAMKMNRLKAIEDMKKIEVLHLNWKMFLIERRNVTGTDRTHVHRRAEMDTNGKETKWTEKINGLKKRIDRFKIKIARVSYLNPKVLLTENTKDIYYRYLFLHDIFENGLAPVETLYYHFISDTDRCSTCNCDGEAMSINFIWLYKDIKKNEIKKPLVVAKFDSSFIKTSYVVGEMKYWKYIKNETGYQLIEGAHRLAIASYLNYSRVPVKIYKPLHTEVGNNYTEFINIKEKEYLERLKCIIGDTNG